jgi:hypothetical protein
MPPAIKPKRRFRWTAAVVGVHPPLMTILLRWSHAVVADGMLVTQTQGFEI